MRTRILTVLVFMVSFLVRVYAQDTTRPLIMSQHAYDSTLRAIKKAAELQQHKDSVKQVDKKQVADTVKAVIIHQENKDSANRSHDSKMDTIKKYVTSLPDLKADTNKKKKIKYTPTGYLELSYSESYPAGNFALNAYPTKGGFTSIIAAFPGIVSHFGVIFKIGFGFNRLDKVRYADSLKSQSGDGNLGVTINDGRPYYTNKIALFGLFYTYPLKRISIDARFLFGIMVATLPATTANVYDFSNGNALTINTFQVSGSAFALDEGISVRYSILPLLSASLGIDNIAAPVSFRTVGSGIAPNPYGVETQTSIKSNTIVQPFHLFTVNLGVCYTISAKRKQSA